MFRKLKDKLADEVKANPRLQGTLDSVNQLAVQTYSSFTKEGSGSRDSLTSLSSQLSNVPCEANGLGNNGASSSQSDLVSLSSPGDLIRSLSYKYDNLQKIVILHFYDDLQNKVIAKNEHQPE